MRCAGKQMDYIQQAQKAASDIIAKRQAEIYANIAQTLEDIAKGEKCKSMSGAEALNHAASLLRDVADAHKV